jgi:hypothetical protein
MAEEEGSYENEVQEILEVDHAFKTKLVELKTMLSDTVISPDGIDDNPELQKEDLYNKYELLLAQIHNYIRFGKEIAMPVHEQTIKLVNEIKAMYLAELQKAKSTGQNADYLVVKTIYDRYLENSLRTYPANRNF